MRTPTHPNDSVCGVLAQTALPAAVLTGFIAVLLCYFVSVTQVCII